MKQMDLFEAFSDIDCDLIVSSEKALPIKSRGIIIRRAVIAACICIVAVSIVVIPIFFKDNPSIGGEPSSLGEFADVPSTEQIEDNTDKAPTQIKEYVALEASGGDSISDVAHKEEIKLIKDEFRDKNAARNIAFTVNEKEYILDYQNSTKNYRYNSACDQYEKIITDSEGNAEFWIRLGVNKSTQRIDLYSLVVDNNYLDGKSNLKKINMDEGLRLVKEFLSEYVNVEEYEVIKRNLNDELMGDMYHFKFVRKINDIETCDMASIVISVYGDIMSYSFVSFGDMDDAPMPYGDELEAIRKCADDKMQAIYSNAPDEIDVHYGVKKEYLVRMENGEYAMIYEYDVQYGQISELVTLVIYV